jgi:FMN phosphatase YigB (HAD superfamily)
MEKKSTIFCDIDGTLFKYRKFETYRTSDPEILPKTLEKFREWKEEGHMIVLTTARPHSLYTHTILELRKYQIPFDKLIMEIERGPRYLINDMDPNKPGLRAIGINLDRDSGFENISWSEYGL